MRLATWTDNVGTSKFGETSYKSYGDTSAYMWLAFRDENIDSFTMQSDVIRDFGIYIWFSKDKKISFTSKFHNIHSADLEKLTAMVKFLKKHPLNTPFYTIEGRNHLQMMIENILAQWKVTEQTNYPSDNITRIDTTEIATTIINHANSLGWAWDF